MATMKRNQFPLRGGIDVLKRVIRGEVLTATHFGEPIAHITPIVTPDTAQAIFAAMLSEAGIENLKVTVQPIAA